MGYNEEENINIWQKYPKTVIFVYRLVHFCNGYAIYCANFQILRYILRYFRVLIMNICLIYMFKL